jgi:hypothetical protein
MPLAPMGCNAQVHEKTDKRGTWAYHSVNGWYLFTSAEHYWTHTCHIKHTKNKCLSNTVQFQHKRITNPTITHADKVMLALSECVKAIQGLTGQAKTSQEAKDLQQIVDGTRTTLHKKPQQCNKPITPIDNRQQVPRVHKALPRVPTAIPRVPSSTSCLQAATTEAAQRECSWKRQVGTIQQATTTLSTSPHARTAARDAPPSRGTQSKSRQTGNPLSTSRTGFAAAVKQQRQYRQGFAWLTKKVSQMDNDIHQAMAVMDTDTGKLLNYRQLMQINKHKKAWSLLSAKNLGHWQMASVEE